MHISLELNGAFIYRVVSPTPRMPLCLHVLRVKHNFFAQPTCHEINWKWNFDKASTVRIPTLSSWTLDIFPSIWNFFKIPSMDPSKFQVWSRRHSWTLTAVRKPRIVPSPKKKNNVQSHIVYKRYTGESDSRSIRASSVSSALWPKFSLRPRCDFVSSKVKLYSEFFPDEISKKEHCAWLRIISCV